MRAWAGWRIGLVLVVGVNLTLICAGHDDGTGHTVPHFAALGEPEDGAHALAPPHVHAAPTDLRVTSPTLLAADLLETLGLTLAEVLLTLGLVYARPPLRRERQAARQQGRPQTALVPERPPPRPALAFA